MHSQYVDRINKVRDCARYAGLPGIADDLAVFIVEAKYEAKYQAMYAAAGGAADQETRSEEQK